MLWFVPWNAYSISVSDKFLSYGFQTLCNVTLGLHADVCLSIQGHSLYLYVEIRIVLKLSKFVSLHHNRKHHHCHGYLIFIIIAVRAIFIIVLLVVIVIITICILVIIIIIIIFLITAIIISRFLFVFLCWGRVLRTPPLLLSAEGSLSNNLNALKIICAKRRSWKMDR